MSEPICEHMIPSRECRIVGCQTSDEIILNEMKRRMDRETEIRDTLPESLPSITRIIMAGDLRSAEDAFARVKAGTVEPERSLWHAGSYGRMTLMMRLLDEGYLNLTQVIALLPEVWTSSDPDDTDPRFIELWEKAFVLNRGTVYDGKALPRRSLLTIWRGQRPGDPLGCAWSLSRTIAERFARGASFRSGINGIVREARVPRGLVLAYLTGRAEDEVIINPQYLSEVSK